MILEGAWEAALASHVAEAGPVAEDTAAREDRPIRLEGLATGTSYEGEEKTDGRETPALQYRGMIETLK